MQRFSSTHVNENVNVSDRLLTPRDSPSRRRYPRQRVTLIREEKKGRVDGPGAPCRWDLILVTVRTMILLLFSYVEDNPFSYENKKKRARTPTYTVGQTNKKTKRKMTPQASYGLLFLLPPLSP